MLQTGLIDLTYKSGMTYAPFYPSDWRSGCAVLTLEEEGLYVRVCAYQYDTGQPIPDHDSTAARLLNVQIHKYRKVMGALIAKGKIVRAERNNQRVLYNERVMRELERYHAKQLLKAQKQAERAGQGVLPLGSTRGLTAQLTRGAATTVDATPGSTPPVTPPVTPLVTPPVTPPVANSQLGGLTPKKPNQFNETKGEGSPPNASRVPDIPESRIQNPEPKGESSSSTATESGARAQARAAAAADPWGLEDGDTPGGRLTRAMVSFIARHAHVSLDRAREMLANNIVIYGADVMAEAFAGVEATMATQPVARAYPYLLKAARLIKAQRHALAQNGPQAAQGGPPGPRPRFDGGGDRGDREPPQEFRNPLMKREYLPPPEEYNDDRWRRLLAIMFGPEASHRNAPWPQRLGPAPGEAGCMVPAHILAEFGGAEHLAKDLRARRP
ncbi:MAG: DUF1376 domain-containing protein [Bacteroidota bacterium]